MLNADLLDYLDRDHKEKREELYYQKLEANNIKLTDQNDKLRGALPLLIDFLNNQLAEYRYYVMQAVNTGGQGLIFKLRDTNGETSCLKVPYDKR